jgi:hypothetical protein
LQFEKLASSRSTPTQSPNHTTFSQRLPTIAESCGDRSRHASRTAAAQGHESEGHKSEEHGSSGFLVGGYDRNQMRLGPLAAEHMMTTSMSMAEVEA